MLFGVAAESLTDRLRIPFAAGAGAGLGIPGAELHGRMTDQLVRYALGEAAPFRSLGDLHEAALVVLCAALAGALMAVDAGRLGLALMGFGSLAALWAVGWLAFQRGLWVPVLPPALAWSASLAIVAAYSRSRERAERVELMQLFGRHVTKQVAESVWQHRDEFMEGGRPRSVRLTATILFIDIKGYTANVEKMDPAELMEWIDGFLGAMAQEVLDRGEWLKITSGTG